MSDLSQGIIMRARHAMTALSSGNREVPAALTAALEQFEAAAEEERAAGTDLHRTLTTEIERAEAAVGDDVVTRSRTSPVAPQRNVLRFAFNILMVALSIVVMIVVAQLSMFYEEGKSLLVDMKSFQSQRMERRISQLERQLIYARAGVENSVTAAAGEQPLDGQPSEPPQSAPQASANGSNTISSDLALERYYDLFFDLKDADRVVSGLIYRSQRFWTDSYNPAPIIGPAIAALQRVYYPTYAEVVANLPKPEGTAAGPCDGYEKIIKRMESQKGTMWMQLVADGRDACMFSLDNRIANYALTLPSMQEHINLIETRLKPYSVWILPVSFAIFGALMFYMRLILNEHLPNPSLTRVLHRIALSAVAAVVLSLFWSSLVSPNGEFEAVGFTVFTLAFVIGFSIDIFFSYLDRTVAVAVGVIKKDETATEKGQSLAEAAKG